MVVSLSLPSSFTPSSNLGGLSLFCSSGLFPPLTLSGGQRTFCHHHHHRRRRRLRPSSLSTASGQNGRDVVLPQIFSVFCHTRRFFVPSLADDSSATESFFFRNFSKSRDTRQNGMGKCEAAVTVRQKLNPFCPGSSRRHHAAIIG